MFLLVLQQIILTKNSTSHISPKVYILSVTNGSYMISYASITSSLRFHYKLNNHLLLKSMNLHLFPQSYKKKNYPLLFWCICDPSTVLTTPFTRWTAHFSQDRMQDSSHQNQLAV